MYCLSNVCHCAAQCLFAVCSGCHSCFSLATCYCLRCSFSTVSCSSTLCAIVIRFPMYPMCDGYHCCFAVLAGPISCYRLHCIGSRYRLLVWLLWFNGMLQQYLSLLLWCPQSLSALDGAHSALSQIYLQQAQRADVLSETGADHPKSLLDDATYSCIYNSIKSSITKNGKRSKTVDPQRNTIQDTYTKDDLEALVNEMLNAGTPVMDRLLAMSAWAHSSVGRSDDVRLFFLADLIAPQYIPAVGKQRKVAPCTMLNQDSAFRLLEQSMHGN
eukprot:GHUV01024388.1.p1 GENE.GHUV01024388.1~~GHUV01024388.1.p1  ORF type:complete len:272 (+),score=42.42 GHUV01024388.1:584-1399(+)